MKKMVRSFDDAQQRIPSQKEKIVNLLRDAGEDGVTNAELARIGLRYGARLTELYKEGFIIDNEPVENSESLYKYVLKAMPGTVTIHQDAETLLVAALLEKFDGGFVDIYEVVQALPKILDDEFLRVTRKPGYYRKRLH